MKIKLAEGATAPTRATDGSAGYDLYTMREETVFANDMPTSVDTGVAMQIPQGYVGLVFPRSGLAIREGVVLRNTVGVIDSDYRGNIILNLVTDDGFVVELEKGQRVAQLVLVPISTPELEVVDELGGTVRGAGGFGSTGA
ncbi:dUTP diphosphatase [uncultured Rothia sp.]|uniref:dUTP diphosphatase n=1 Tax=uncultured Rothia sp. TaxID=316088 RepID=UPI0032167AA6